MSDQEQSQEYLRDIKMYNLEYKNTIKYTPGGHSQEADVTRTDDDDIENYPECLKESFKNMRVL